MTMTIVNSSLNKGPFTHTISVTMSVKATVRVYHCANGDGPFDRHIGSGPHSVHQCKFDRLQ